MNDSHTVSRLIIRRAGPGDLPACAAIVNDWIDETDWLPRLHSRVEIEGFFDVTVLEKRIFLVAETAEGVAGYLTIDPQGTIRALYLCKHQRNSGIGKQLLDEARALFPEQLELGVLEKNTGARKFYKREGFDEIPEGRVENTDEGVAELLMRWEGTR